MKKTVLIVTIIFITASGLYSQSGIKMLDKKQTQQLKKIDDGIKLGEITKIEAKKLIKQKRQLTKFNNKAKTDGFISPKEKAKLKNKTKKLDRKIYKEKHDKQKREK